ncbi:MAG TPA: DsbA family oxidoreductase, partial [Micromonosporaceae bacterium]
MEIEIFADVVCPWCYLGKRRLENALAAVDADVVLRWRPLQLDPNLPYQGQPLLPWLAARFGGADRARQAMTQVTAAARADGLVLDFDRALIANTFDAHRLIWFADQPQAVVFGAGPDTQMELVEALHRAHLTDGRDISTIEVLASVAASVGLDPDRLGRLLRSTEGVADVRGQIAHAHDLG